MRAYAMGEADASLIEGIAAQVESFRLRFLGKQPPILPSPEILEYEERWRDVQRNGPQTRGGNVDGAFSMQI